MYAAILGSNPVRIEILIKVFVPGTTKDSEAEPQPTVSVPNIFGLNPKSLRSTNDVKEYVMLIRFVSLVEKLNLTIPLSALR